jgi:formate hydrogenlyase subunit 3/multisubunit Na+/H+ antiporter MnhD subunit
VEWGDDELFIIAYLTKHGSTPLEDFYIADTFSHLANPVSALLNLSHADVIYRTGEYIALTEDDEQKRQT